MPEVRPANPDAGKALPPDVSRSVAALTRALVAAARGSDQARGDVPHAVVEAVDPDSVQLDPLSYL